MSGELVRDGARMVMAAGHADCPEPGKYRAWDSGPCVYCVGCDRRCRLPKGIFNGHVITIARRDHGERKKNKSVQLGLL